MFIDEILAMAQVYAVNDRKKALPQAISPRYLSMLDKIARGPGAQFQRALLT